MTPETLAVATALLRRATGHPVQALDARLVRRGGRSTVWRCRVGGAPGGAGAPRTVIVKSLAPDSPLGLIDLATLEFLGDRPATARWCPGWSAATLRGAGGGARGPGRDGHPGRPAERFRRRGGGGRSERGRRPGGAVRAPARRDGGPGGEFAAACARLPGATPEGREAEAARWLNGLDRTREWLAAAGCAEPPGLGELGARVADVYAAPGAYLTLTHGDPAPTNAHVGASAGDVRLLDFEYAAYRHAFYDLTAWAVLCPLPEPLLAAMRRRYLTLLSPAFPAAADAATAGAAWGAMATFRALAVLSWISVQTVDRNGPWVGDWTRREAVLTVLDRLERATAGTAALVAATALARALGERLRVRWPEQRAGDTAPRWPAFGAAGDNGQREGPGPRVRGARGTRGSGGDEAAPPAVDAEGVGGQVGDPGADGQDA